MPYQDPDTRSRAIWSAALRVYSQEELAALGDQRGPIVLAATDRLLRQTPEPSMQQLQQMRQRMEMHHAISRLTQKRMTER